jgi:hypothetical protein
LDQSDESVDASFNHSHDAHVFRLRCQNHGTVVQMSSISSGTEQRKTARVDGVSKLEESEVDRTTSLVSK